MRSTANRRSRGAWALAAYCVVIWLIVGVVHIQHRVRAFFADDSWVTDFSLQLSPSSAPYGAVLVRYSSLHSTSLSLYIDDRQGSKRRFADFGATLTSSFPRIGWSKDGALLTVIDKAQNGTLLTQVYDFSTRKFWSVASRDYAWQPDIARLLQQHGGQGLIAYGPNADMPETWETLRDDELSTAPDLDE